MLDKRVIIDITCKLVLLVAILLIFSIQHLHAHHLDTLSLSLPKNISFVENKNQWPSQVLFRANMANGAIFVEKDKITYLLHKPIEKKSTSKNNTEFHHVKESEASSYQMHFVAPNPNVVVKGVEEYGYHHNYFIGNNPAQWASEVKAYQSVVLENIYPGVDMLLYENGESFKYDFIVQPYVSPDVIELEYKGIDNLSLVQKNLTVRTSIDKVTELSPVTYQVSPKGDTVAVKCEYKLKDNRVSYKLGSYDKSSPLIIDPTLVFSSYSGSTSDNWGYTATYDSDGNLYGGGIVAGQGYPVTDSSYQSQYGGTWDIAISKFNATGDQLLYTTYLGGESSDMPHSMVVNENDELYVFGTTGSGNFPVTWNAYDTSFNGGNRAITSSQIPFANGSDIIVAKFSQNGSELLASTYIGGSGNDGLNTVDGLRYNYADDARGEIMVDDQSNVYVVSTTQSVDFPVTDGVFQPTYAGGRQDGVVFKLNYNLSNLMWSSFIGGEGSDAAYSLSIASDNSLYVCGGTNSKSFPVTDGVIQPTLNGEAIDGFVAHIDENGRTLLHSTYLGSGYYDQSYLIKTDRLDHPYVFGQTEAPDDFWIRNAAWHKQGGGQFVSKLTPGLDSIVWSTAFGTGKGLPDISPTAFLVDYCNSIYISGWGNAQINHFGGTSGLPITADAYQNTTNGRNYYFLCMKDDASDIVYGTYFGSTSTLSRGEHVDGGTSRFDRKGKIYQAVCAGCGANSFFPATPGAWSETNNSDNCNLAVVKMDFNLPSVVADFQIPSTVCAPIDIVFQNNSQTISDTTTYLWDFGDGTTSTEENPVHHFDKSGTYLITLTVTDQGSCNFDDVRTRRLTVLANSTSVLDPLTICEGLSVQIGVQPGTNPDLVYQWMPETGLNNPNISNPIASPDTSTFYTLQITDGICYDTIVQQVDVRNVQIIMPEDTMICRGETVILEPLVETNATTLFYWSTNPQFSTILNQDLTNPVLTIAPDKTTTYYFKTKFPECELVYPVTIQVSYVTLLEPKEYFVCFNQSVTIEVEADVCEGCSFLWDDDETILTPRDRADIMVNPQQTTTYYVTATDIYGCSARKSIEVLWHENTFLRGLEAQTRDKIVMGQDSTYIYATNYGSNYEYVWTPQEGIANPNAASSAVRPEASTIYTITVTDQYGCKMQDTVLIILEETQCGEPYIYVPNAFTPNGDGHNDLLYVRGEEIIEKIIFRIYNKWGEEIFYTDTINKGWDGTFKRKEAPGGVYDFYLETMCIDGRSYVKKGNITLIR